jgi:hypothetical protein
MVSATGLGVVFFRAGAAPWHDDLEVYRRTISRMPAGTATFFESLHLWDICALIAHGRAYCGSSLHGRIVAAAYALPRVTLHHPSPAGRTGKQVAYTETWEPAATMPVVGVERLAPAVLRALEARQAPLRELALELVRHYRSGFEIVADRLTRH